MALVTDREAPSDIPTTNELARFQLEKPPAEIRMAGKTLTILEEPPGLGDAITLMVKVEVTEICEKQKADGEIVYYRKAKLIGCWKPGERPPDNDEQPGLFDHGGEPQTVGEVLGEMATDDE